MYLLTNTQNNKEPWNIGKLIGQKSPLKLKDIWAIRIHLKMKGRTRDLALFNLAIDSKLRAGDLVKLRVKDISNGGQLRKWAIIMQQKTRSPVQFEITPQTRDALSKWINKAALHPDIFLFQSRIRPHHHISTRQYGRKLLK